jgi:hypothetical protein
MINGAGAILLIKTFDISGFVESRRVMQNHGGRITWSSMKVCVLCKCVQHSKRSALILCTQKHGMQKVVHSGLHFEHVCMCFCNSRFPKIGSL